MEMEPGEEQETSSSEGKGSSGGGYSADYSSSDASSEEAKRQRHHNQQQQQQQQQHQHSSSSESQQKSHGNHHHKGEQEHQSSNVDSFKGEKGIKLPRAGRYYLENLLGPEADIESDDDGSSKRSSSIIKNKRLQSNKKKDDDNEFTYRVPPQWNGVKILHPMDPRIDLSSVRRIDTTLFAPGITTTTGNEIVDGQNLDSSTTNGIVGSKRENSNEPSIDLNQYASLMEAVRPFFNHHGTFHRSTKAASRTFASSEEFGSTTSSSKSHHHHHHHHHHHERNSHRKTHEKSGTPLSQVAQEVASKPDGSSEQKNDPKTKRPESGDPTTGDDIPAFVTGSSGSSGNAGSGGNSNSGTNSNQENSSGSQDPSPTMLDDDDDDQGSISGATDMNRSSEENTDNTQDLVEDGSSNPTKRQMSETSSSNKHKAVSSPNHQHHHNQHNHRHHHNHHQHARSRLPSNDDSREVKLQNKKRKRMNMRREYEEKVQQEMDLSESTSQRSSESEAIIRPGKPTTIDKVLGYTSTNARLLISAKPPFIILHANAAYSKLSGNDCHAAIGKPISELLDPGDTASLSQLISSCCNGKCHIVGVKRMMDSSGCFPCNMIVSPVVAPVMMMMTDEMDENGGRETSNGANQTMHHHHHHHHHYHNGKRVTTTHYALEISSFDDQWQHNSDPPPKKQMRLEELQVSAPFDLESSSEKETVTAVG